LAEGSFRKIRDGEIVVGYIGNMPVTMNTLLDMNSLCAYWLRAEKNEV
jgi:hypothetical protein